MDIASVFYRFEEIGVCVFSTIDGDFPETRIAHFIAYDNEGLYFMTMNCKPFYKQLKETGKVSVLGLKAATQVKMTADRNLIFDPGYFIRITGEAKEVPIEEIREKHNPMFDYGLEDVERYPNMVFFVINKYKGEIYDYDFDKIHRNHKLERERFSFGNMAYLESGFIIADSCIGCGKCEMVCTFDAISIKENGQRLILGNRCDECGNCMNACPADAIRSRI